MSRAVFAAVTLLGLLNATTGTAHHSISAMYARENSVTLEGKVIRFEYVNPHPNIHLETQSAAGNAEVWVIEWSSRNRLETRGYTADTLRSGDQVVISGAPARDGSKRLFVSKLVRPADGFEYVSSRAVPTP
jgi:Family of unknown function (DUF6152)